MKAPELRTDRLLLRPHRVADFDRLAAVYETPRSMHIGGPLTRAEAWRGFASDVGSWALLGFGAWAIELRQDGSYLGQLGLNHPAEYPEREIGWLLWEEFEGHGYAFEAAMCARDFAYGRLGWTTVVSYIDPENAKSISLAQRMGATLDANAPTPNDEGCHVYRHPAPA